MDLVLITDKAFPTRTGTSTQRDTTPDLCFVKNVADARWSNLAVDLGSDHFLLAVHLAAIGRRTKSYTWVDWDLFPQQKNNDKSRSGFADDRRTREGRSEKERATAAHAMHQPPPGRQRGARNTERQARHGEATCGSRLETTSTPMSTQRCRRTAQFRETGARYARNAGSAVASAVGESAWRAPSAGHRDEDSTAARIAAARTPPRRSDRMRGKTAAVTYRNLLMQSSDRALLAERVRTCSDASPPHHSGKKRVLGRPRCERRQARLSFSAPSAVLWLL
ncbi:hypothetical protein HPB50_025005 [Hyalomma asiaticum]|uniref:Uncharacterized protein n=1 Tax=Hyalomma asiaticum TaxID=266040 RepID=A0ACB7SZU1_HYAAI|nr:hypothetical protein HPB50_025005 [Hyalomma asiaticum]